jgi:hypothetical protein
MGGHHDGQTLVPVQAADDVEERLLVGKVERERGFVQQEDPWFLREGGGQQDALALAARERIERTVRQGGGVAKREGSIASAAVLGGEATEPSRVDEAPHLHALEHRQGEGEVDRLGKVSDGAGPRRGGRLWERPSIEDDLAPLGVDQAGEEPQKGRFAGAVRPQEGVKEPSGKRRSTLSRAFERFSP